MKDQASKPLTERGWAIVLALVIIVDDVSYLIDRVDSAHVTATIADLVLIVWMLFAFYGKRSADCMCGKPTTAGSVHRADAPCYVAEQGR